MATPSPTATIASSRLQGNLLATEWRLAEDYTTVPDWTGLAAETDPTAIFTAAAALLEREAFTTAWTYDARMRAMLPDGS